MFKQSRNNYSEEREKQANKKIGRVHLEKEAEEKRGKLKVNSKNLNMRNMASYGRDGKGRAWEGGTTAVAEHRARRSAGDGARRPPPRGRENEAAARGKSRARTKGRSRRGRAIGPCAPFLVAALATQRRRNKMGSPPESFPFCRCRGNQRAPSLRGPFRRN